LAANFDVGIHVPRIDTLQILDLQHIEADNKTSMCGVLAGMRLG
jgi:hypothetical protein